MKTEQVRKLNDKNYSHAIKESLAVIDFWAPWCGPCRAMGPIFEEAASKLGEKAVFGKVDVDENPQLAAQFGVRAIPTLVFVKNGHVLRKMTGIQTVETIKKTLETL